MTTELTGMTAIKTLMQEFDAVENYLKALQEVLQQGHMPDIAGLDKQVASLCAIVEKVSPDIRDKCTKKLDGILTQINDCEEDMRELYTTLKQRQS